ncbi:MAG: hypothetical protein GEV13_21110 [Rhodospirillales bacterium]|nr:hypothetical protein [Rhodospirillales bacterium]
MTIPVVMALSTAMCGVADAQDAMRGQALAERWCANCHVVNRAATTGRADGLPTFPSLARARTSRRRRSKGR